MAPAPVTTQDIVLAIFHFYPSEPAAGLFLALFFIAALWNSYVTVRTRTPFMAWVGGYAARIYVLYHPGRGPSIAMNVLLIVSPTLLALTDYVLVQKVMQVTNIRLRWLSPKAVSYLFLASDVLCLMIQSIGAAVALGGDGVSGAATGRALLIVGLALQLAFFALFTLVAMRVDWVYKRSVAKAAGQPARVSVSETKQEQEEVGAVVLSKAGSVESAIFCLYSTIGLLSLRNVYRFVEFVQGFDGYLATNEWFFYVFDAVLILGAIVIFNVKHPGKDLLGSAAAVAGDDKAGEGAARAADVEAGRAVALVAVAGC